MGTITWIKPGLCDILANFSTNWYQKLYKAYRSKATGFNRKASHTPVHTIYTVYREFFASGVLFSLFQRLSMKTCSRIYRGVQPVALSHVRATDGSKCATSDFQVWPLFLTVWRENKWSFAKCPLPGNKNGPIPQVRLFNPFDHDLLINTPRLSNHRFMPPGQLPVVN